MKFLPMNFIKGTLTKIKLAILSGIFQYFPGLVQAIVTRYLASVDQVGIIYHALSHSRDPVITLNFFSNHSGYPWTTIWAAVKKVSRDEKTVWRDLFRARALLLDIELRLCIEVTEYLSVESGEIIDFSALVNEYSGVVSPSAKPGTLGGMLATLLVARAPIEDVVRLLDQIGAAPSSLTEFQQIKFLTRLEQQGERDKFQFWQDRLASSFSKAGRLKVALLNAGLFEVGASRFPQLEKEFLSLPFRASEKYRDEVNPVYSRIPNSMNFLAARFDAEQKRKLRSLVINAIEEGDRLSYLRLGDGECYGFADQANVDEFGEVRQEEHWWGEQLDVPLRHELQARFRESVAESTILGVPTVLRLIRDFNLSYRGDYPVNSLMARIFCVMKESASYYDEKFIVEDQSNLYLFDQSFIEMIFNAAEKVCVVSGVKADLIERWAPDRTKLQCIEVPTHRLLREGNVGSTTPGILPHVYKRYLESIRAHAGPNVVFLVSAGFIGKIFVAEAARQGSVALDVGQTLVSVAEKTRVSG
ncbi:MAG: hypothetical protein JJ867_00295 [Marinobacter sp.]|nr:hypothetical protein [Marinobacter sp.]